MLEIVCTDGTFDIYAQDADLLGGEYPFFGWAWVRLVPIDAPPPEMHYITERHEAGESISTGNMTLVCPLGPVEPIGFAPRHIQAFPCWHGRETGPYA